MDTILWVNLAFVTLVFGAGVWFLVWKIRSKLTEVEERQDGSRERFFEQEREKRDTSD